MKSIYALVIIILITGCSPKPYVDITNESRFQHVIGKRFQSQIDLKAHGVTFGVNGNWNVDHVCLTPPPGISSNYVKFYSDLSSNKTFEIIGVAKNAYSSFFGLFYKVKILNSNEYKKYKIYIDVPNDITTPNKGLDNNAFKLLPTKA